MNLDSDMYQSIMLLPNSLKSPLDYLAMAVRPAKEWEIRIGLDRATAELTSASDTVRFARLQRVPVGIVEATVVAAEINIVSTISGRL